MMDTLSPTTFNDKLLNTEKMNKGTLYLIPTGLGSKTTQHIWPIGHLQTIKHIRYFIVENVRSARRFLQSAGYEIPFDEISFYTLDKHTVATEIESYMNAVRLGHDIGLLSEAGVPCIADPGQAIVQIAHQSGIRVIPLVGASSIILALMASGFNGQQFVFHGYLPIPKQERAMKIREMEKAARQLDQTQIFMETPFRNNQLLADLLKTCRSDTLLGIACDLTLPDEFIHTLPVREWSKKLPDLHKRPGIFLLYHNKQ